MRFDGKLGFPGGEIDELNNFDFANNNGSDFMRILEAGLKREVNEEMTFDIGSSPKYIFSSVPESNGNKAVILHFFSIEVIIGKGLLLFIAYLR